MRLLCTGAAGMLGTAVREVYSQLPDAVWTDLESVGDDVEQLDVRDWTEVDRRVRDFKPDVLLHLAAETDVDKCESDSDHAFQSNAFATENVARACQGAGSTLVYISTGNVFDGKKETPYTEYDSPSPINTYGRAKLAGEQVVAQWLHSYYIVRAGWMVGGWEIDKKFVYKMVQLCQTQDEILAVDDKFGSPTFTVDFARNLPEIIGSGRFGLYHMVNGNGTCSRFEIAQEIVRALGKEEKIRVKPVSSDTFPMAAERPASEMLRNLKLGLIGLDRMPDWKNSLREYIISNAR